MENEIMNNVANVEEIDLNEDVIVVCEDSDNSGDGNPIGLVIAGIAAAIGVAALVLKRKGKFDEWRIKRLEKKGYVVLKPEEVEPKDIINCNEEEEEIDG